MLNATERHALELARQRIAEGKHVHLCYALNAVSGTVDTLAMTHACNRLKSYIMKSLYPRSTLDDWIARHHHDRQPHSLNERREARIQWIDWMLDEPAKTLVDVPVDTWPWSSRPVTMPVPRDSRPVRLDAWPWQAETRIGRVRAVPRVETLVTTDKTIKASSKRTKPKGSAS